MLVEYWGAVALKNVQENRSMTPRPNVGRGFRREGEGIPPRPAPQGSDWSDIAASLTVLYTLRSSFNTSRTYTYRIQFSSQKPSFLRFAKIETMIQTSAPTNGAPHLEQHQHNDPIADAKAQEATQNYTFRPANTADIPALQTIIGESLRALGSEHYTQAELDGSIGWLFGPDTVLLSVSCFLPRLCSFENLFLQSACTPLAAGCGRIGRCGCLLLIR